MITTTKGGANSEWNGHPAGRVLVSNIHLKIGSNNASCNVSWHPQVTSALPDRSQPRTQQLELSVVRDNRESRHPQARIYERLVLHLPWF